MAYEVQPAEDASGRTVWRVVADADRAGSYVVSTHDTKQAAINNMKQGAPQGERLTVVHKSGGQKVIRESGRRGRRRRRDPGAKFDADFLDAATQDPQEIERRGGFGLEDDL